MGQTVDNGMNNINKILDAYSYKADSKEISYSGIKETNYGVSNSYDNVFKYEQDSRKDTLKNTTMENFEEYMKSRQERAKETGQDVAARERQAKASAKEISRSLTSEEIKQLEMMGIDVDTAQLSDLMGMVNTLRHNTHRQETKELMAKITMDSGNTQSLSVIGGNVKTADGVELQGVSVSDVVTSDSQTGAMVDGEAETDAAIGHELQDTQKKAGESFSISDQELLYIIKNNMPVDKSSLYRAHFSSVAPKHGMSGQVMEQLMPQLEKLIEQAGYDVSDESVAGAKLLMENDLPVTTDNIKKYMDFQQYIGKSPEETGLVETVVVDENQLIMDKADKLYEDVKSINPAIIYDMVAEGKNVSIAAAVKYTRSKQKDVGNGAVSFVTDSQMTEALTNVSEGNATARELKAVTAMRQMEEIRLSMTQEAAAKLVKMDINIDTRELSRVVAVLKDMEQKLIGDTLSGAGIPATKENISLYQQTNQKVLAIAEGHAKVLASPLMGAEFTIDGVYGALMSDGGDASEHMAGWQDNTSPGANAGIAREAFEGVRRSYEAVGTAPRADMGDSIKKAFSNVQDILSEMELPVNYENERAVRILGYNSLEITVENIQQVVEYDRQVNDMINGFYPEAVLGMIKDGINPMDVPINKLNQIIRSRNYNEGVTEAKNFATFLRDMDNQGELTTAERESYIGMYRVLEGLAKSGDREAGWIFANGSRLTVRNIVAAMRSTKAKGLDVNVDDSFGMLQEVNRKGKKIDEQIEGAFDSLRQVAPETEEYMEANSIEYTAVNVKAVDVMLNTEGGIYNLVTELLSRMKFTTNSKAKLVDEETENMSDSLLGQHIPVEFTAEHILEQLRGSEEMSLTYEDLRNQLTEMMYQAGVAGNLTQMDIASIKVVNAGFNIMSHMAKQERFQVPVETSTGTKVINLTIKRDSDNRGLIQVDINSESLGHITAGIKAYGDNSLGGYIVSDSSDGNYSLMENEQAVRESFAKTGYDVSQLSIGAMKDIGGISGIVSEKLYQVSVAVVKSISVAL